MDPVYIAIVVLVIYFLFVYVYQINYRNDKYGTDKIGGVRGDLNFLGQIPDSELESFVSYSFIPKNCYNKENVNEIAKDFLNCNPSCCPSTYSCSKGCVCLNKQQKDLINSRGNNRTGYSNY